MADTPLILFSGMGADERVFAPQLVTFPQLVVPKWIEPRRGESLAAYAQRFAHHVDPRCECFVGGASFGGFVAIEVARHLRARACFLIGSARGPGEFPLRIRAMRRLARLLPWAPFEWAGPLAGISTGASGWAMRPTTRQVLRQLADADAAFLRWACGAVLTWDASDIPAVPVYQIHGARDRVLPATRSKADVVVPGAGHVLSLTHANEVNEFLKARMGADE